MVDFMHVCVCNCFQMFSFILLFSDILSTSFCEKWEKKRKWFLNALFWSLDLLYSLSWWWVNGGKGSSIETTICLMLSFSPRYYCTIWAKTWRLCQLGRVSWESCCANEWYSPNPLHSRAYAHLNRFEGHELEGSLEDYSGFFSCHGFHSYMPFCGYLNMLCVTICGSIGGDPKNFKIQYWVVSSNWDWITTILSLSLLDLWKFHVQILPLVHVIYWRLVTLSSTFTFMARRSVHMRSTCPSLLPYQK